MKLKTVVKDALYLTWAVPTEALPELPPALGYERQGVGETSFTFVTAVLARFDGLHLDGLPLVRLSYPQLSLRLAVRDADNIPAQLTVSVLVPSWVAPGARVALRQPASTARFEFPEPIGAPRDEGWRWSVGRKGELAVSARPGAPSLPACAGLPDDAEALDETGAAPRFASWERLVRWLWERDRHYTLGSDGLERIDLDTGEAELEPVWPVVAEVESAALLTELLPLASWPPLYAAWLCPEFPLALAPAAVPEEGFAPGGLPATG